MEYLVQFNYSGRVTYEIEADDEETAKREAANRGLFGYRQTRWDTIPSLRVRILSMTL